MEDEDVLPQDLSYRSQNNSNNHANLLQYSNLNGHNYPNNCNSHNSDVILHSKNNIGQFYHDESMLNGNENAFTLLANSDLPIDLVTEKHAWKPEKIASAQPLVNSINFFNNIESSANLKRKHNGNSEVAIESNRISPKHMKLFRPYTNDRPCEKQQPVQELSNCTQTSNSESYFNPSLFKNMDEMKYFLKHQLQFSDLSNLFGNVDLSAGSGGSGGNAQFLGLQPSVKFKCFKCDKSTFLSLVELKDHQTTCLRNNHTHEKVEAENDAEADHHVNLTNEDTLQLTKQIDTKIRITRKVFLCSACGTYYENWNLFHHMREVHNKFICLHCLGIFQSADRLVHHLEVKHTAKPFVYEHKEHLLAAIKDQCYLMCCVCEHIFSEHDNFTSHSCENYIKPCVLCGLKFIHRPNCCQASVQSVSRQTSRHHKEREKPKNKNSDASSSKVKKDRRVRKSNGSIYCNQLNGDATGNDAKPIKESADAFTEFDVNSSCIQSLQPPTTATSLQFPQALTQLMNVPSVNTSQLLLPQQLIAPPIAPIIAADPPNLLQNNNLSVQQLNDLDKFQRMLFNSSSTEVNNTIKESSHNQALLSAHTNVNDQFEDYLHAEDIDMVNGFFDKMKENEDDEKNADNNISMGSNGIQENIALDADAVDDSAKVFEIDSVKIEEENTLGKPLLVPKLKLKLSKPFQAPIESEESSTESDDELYVDETVENVNEEEAIEQEPELETHQESQPEIDETEINKNEDNEYVDLAVEPDEPDDVKEDERSSTVEEIRVEKTQYDLIVAGEEIYVLELLLKQPLDKINIREFLKICLNAAYPLCLYCNHARQIAVNGNSLALHFISHHKFSATVDSITAEELHPATIVQRIKCCLDEVNDMYFNLDTYDSCDKQVTVSQEKLYECFQCRFQSRVHKELYLHNRKMHLKSILMCLMCKANFYSYSELVCHMCPGSNNKLIMFELKFRCVLCNLDQIPSAFRLMVHLRKKHFACDVCLEECFDQSKLSSHVWKHKLHHLCYRCNITYRNKLDITKHLFWKHGTESVLCKRCLQKKWPHVYHFCVPPSSFVCETCNLSFSKAVALKVHKRIHSEDAPYPCTEDGCQKKFISRKLLLKHVKRHSAVEEPPAEIQQEDKILKQPEEEEDKLENKDGTTNEPQPKQKMRKSKKNKEKEPINTSNLIDIINMPAPNLSESDSSDESDNEKNISTAKHLPSELNSFGNVDVVLAEEEENKPAPIIDIWENFKSYQASQLQEKLEIDEPPPPPPPILHVTQSDHDYCLMYKVLTKSAVTNKPDNSEESNLNEITESVLQKITETGSKPTQKPAKALTSPKKGRSPKKGLPKSATESSSENSSDSSSSCSCGSNCSCSTSSDSSSSSSSSSDDSDSDKSGKRKKKAVKKEKRDRLKSEASSKANLSDNIDVVTTDKPISCDPDSIIFESDLETDESETDEDFYDDHPQKLACQMLAEKRKQLVLQTCPNLLNNYDIVENSRPSTPSLPEELLKAKKNKAKKRKKGRKNSSKIIPPLKINIPLNKISQSRSDVEEPKSLPPQPTPPLTCQLTQPEQIKLKISTSNLSSPANIQFNKPRLSTGSSCSDIDTPLKRSKRRRIPNKFYGYTSDEDDSTIHSTNAIISNAFKPQPPPNLTWHKEDLPCTPTLIRTPPIKSVIKIPQSLKALSTPASPKGEYKSISPGLPLTACSTTNTPSLVVPPIIIRPNRVSTQPRPPAIESRVPAVPVHHIIPPSDLPQSNSEVSAESSSNDSSDEEGALQISHPGNVVTNNQENPTDNNPQATQPNEQYKFQLPPIQSNQIRYPIMPPAGCRPAREGESVYCYCRCPYDEVSEMIACDGTDCPIEWFHFECVNIMVPPKGTWYCPQCRPKYVNDKQQQQEQHFQDIT